MHFCYFLVREQTYVDVKQRLVPRWKDVLSQHPDLDPHIPFSQLPAPSAPDDPINQYITALRSDVSNQLRCREQGAPADWVCHAVHGGITGTSIDAGVTLQHYLWHGSLHIPIGSAGFAAVVAKINDIPLADESEADRLAIETQHPGTPFTRWKALKQGYKTRTEVTMGKLVRWVVGHERQFAGDRSATNDLLHDLGLDAPGRSTSEQFGDFPEKFLEAGPSENP